MAMYARKSHGTLYLNILRRITLVMSVKVENLEHNMAKLTIEVSAEELEKALNTAYNKQKRQISVPGFRKGKVPRVVLILFHVLRLMLFRLKKENHSFIQQK